MATMERYRRRHARMTWFERSCFSTTRSNLHVAGCAGQECCAEADLLPRMIHPCDACAPDTMIRESLR
jgi:hypothetical protein